MNIYFIDSNFFLRYLLKDDLAKIKIIRDYLLKAQKGEIKIVCITEIVLEIEYVLRKVYKYNKKVISQLFTFILKLSYLDFPDRDVLTEAINIYLKKTIDLVDLVLYFKAKEKKAEVLSFDKDLQKITLKNW